MTGRNITTMLTPLAAAALVVGLGTSAVAAPAAAAAPGRRACVLGPNRTIKHVIYIQFDNTHFTRDNPRVPSDLEQMPNLLNFIKGGGTLVTHEHTPLIAHTADDIVTSESGLYGSDQGVPIANEYHYYIPGGSSDQAGSFAYWTDPIVDYYTGPASKPIHDSTPTMINSRGKNAPAPWVSYTRAGCNFGTIAAANTELENTLPDVPHVFGANSPEAKEAEHPSAKDPNEAQTDFMGIAVHCALNSVVCAKGSRPDLLPDEPGGYHGFRALFGSKFVQPVISPAGPVRDLNGQVIKDSAGRPGFPGYGGIIGVTGLAYTLDMQTHGIPVTFTYLSDLHDSEATGSPFGPGQPGYERQLKAENKAFGVFFSQLAAHGITKANTLFVITSDEGDHFVGSKPTPANCDGVKIACHYKRIGEVNVDLNGLVAKHGLKTPFDVQSDASPSVYVHHQPGRTAASVRALERAVAALRGHDLATGANNVKMTNFLADPVELKILHMLTGDPKRNPTFTVFGNPEFWQNGGGLNCGKSCFSEPAGTDAWNHGTIASDVNTTWLGLVGPGVATFGVDNSLWSDHADIQPTMMELLALRDDYQPDGRVLAELIRSSALPAAMRSHSVLLRELGAIYKRLEAPVGDFGLLTLRASTRGLASKSSRDREYATTEAALARLGAQRDAIGGQIRTLLLGAAFGGKPISSAKATAAIRAGDKLLRAAVNLAG